jgi:adenylate cyclase
MLGAKKLRGVQEKVTILAPSAEDMKLGSVEATGKNKSDAGSEAEQVMLLYRNSRDKKKPRKIEGNFVQ